jgi:hypothetical protein
MTPMPAGRGFIPDLQKYIFSAEIEESAHGIRGADLVIDLPEAVQNNMSDPLSDVL